MKINFDVDIDFADRDRALEGLPFVSASIERDGSLERHNTGIYLQDIPRDPFTNQANIDYKEAEALGYFKIDCLNASVYEGIRNEEHLIQLMSEPDWNLLLVSEIVKELFHIGDYYALVKQYAPKSIEQLAMLLAIIRPSKRHLQGKPWQEIEKTVWDKPTDKSYHFKKSHSLSYAMAIVVQLNLLKEQAKGES